MAIERRAAPKRPYLKLAQRLLAVPDARMDGGLRGALPSAVEIASIAEDLMTVLFPSSGRSFAVRGHSPSQLRESLAASLAALERRLEEAVFLGLHRHCRDHGAAADGCRRQAGRIVQRLLGALPDVRALLVKDVEAALEGDPAATGPEEIIACYPGLYAIAIYRAANRLL